MITAYAITMAVHVSHENLVANVALYVLAAKEEYRWGCHSPL